MGLATTPNIVLVGCIDHTSGTTAGVGIIEVPLNAAYDTPGTI